jgi:hypothetical protein
MAQSDQVVQNATFPSVRADINDNLAALYSQSSGNSAPSVTVAFQPWVDTSSSPPIKKVRNGSNTAWITEGVLDPAGFQVGGITAIANGGTGATTATAALAALLPSQSGNAGKALVTSGSAASWGIVGGTAKAWVNFNGTGTVAIRASYNVSSITDNGTGDYTVNFTTAMADANYSATFGSAIESAAVGGFACINDASIPTASALRIRSVSTGVSSTVTADKAYVHVSIFR